MYLNNPKANLNIYNRIIGIITNIDMKTNLIQVLFNILGGIIDINIEPIINYFTIKETHASCHQFPLQNCYTLTVLS